MRKNNATIFGSMLLSFLILIAVPFVPLHDSYFIKNVEANSAKPDLASQYMKTISYSQLSKQDKKEVDCLAKNIYHEAANEPINGWLGVASVTLNRLRSGNYADSVCGVVYQKHKGFYQFSWVASRNRLNKVDEEVYNDILKVATNMYVTYDGSKDVTRGATYYHADYVNPRWKQLEKTKKIGKHIFYKSDKDVL